MFDFGQVPSSRLIPSLSQPCCAGKHQEHEDQQQLKQNNADSHCHLHVGQMEHNWSSRLRSVFFSEMKDPLQVSTAWGSSSVHNDIPQCRKNNPSSQSLHGGGSKLPIVDFQPDGPPYYKDSHDDVIKLQFIF